MEPAEKAYWSNPIRIPINGQSYLEVEDSLKRECLETDNSLLSTSKMLPILGLNPPEEPSIPGL